MGWSCRIIKWPLIFTWLEKEIPLSVLGQQDKTKYVSEQTQKVSLLGSFLSWTMCSGVHQAKNSWSLLDRPFSRWACSATPDSWSTWPPRLSFKAPSPGSRYLRCSYSWVKAQADNKNKPRKESSEFRTTFLFSSVMVLLSQIRKPFGPKCPLYLYVEKFEVQD